MKTSHFVLVFGILMACMIPLCVYGVGSGEPNADNLKHNAQGILKNRAENKTIREDPNEQAKQTLMRKTQELQYTQLLEVHRSYFMAFLQVLAIYLAVMGACLKFICDSIEKMKNGDKKEMKNGDKKEMKNGDKKGSRTVLFALITFAVVTSTVFFVGLCYGRKDVNERKDQIFNIEKSLQIGGVADELQIKHISVKLLLQVIVAMSIVTGLIIVGWYVMFIRGLMAAGKKLRWPLIIETGILLICWLLVPLEHLHLQNLHFMILIGIVTALFIAYWIITLVRDRQNPLGTS